MLWLDSWLTMRVHLKPEVGVIDLTFFTEQLSMGVPEIINEQCKCVSFKLYLGDGKGLSNDVRIYA